MKLGRSGTEPKGSVAAHVSVQDAPARPQTVGQWIGVILVLAMFGLLGTIGVLALVAGIRQMISGEQTLPLALLAIALGLVFIAIGFGFFYFRYVKKPLWDADAARLAARYPGQPWMLRKDWTARRIVHSNLGLLLMLWLWNLGWWGGLAIVGTVNRTKIEAALSDSWGSWFLAAFFVGIGLLVLRFAVTTTRDHLRFGRTTLHLDSLPAYFGDRFRGSVEARLQVRPAKPLKAELICERLEWVRQLGAGKKTWKLNKQDLVRISQEIPPPRILVSRRGARIPVEIELPVKGFESSLDSQGNGIRWTLHVQTAEGENPAFACAFEVPIYARRG